MSGTATLAVRCARPRPAARTPRSGRTSSLFDPGTSTCTELGAADVTVSTNANQAWTEHDLTRSLANVTGPAGGRIEIKLVTTGGTWYVEIACDTTRYPSALTLP